jgi:hypothetical protein
MEQTFKHRARNAGAIRRSVVTIAHALSTLAHEAMGLAESPAFRAPLGISGLPDMPVKEGPRVWNTGAPAPAKK